VAGTWGALATGLFAAPPVNEAAGLFYGNPAQLGIQAMSVVATIVFVFVVTYVMPRSWTPSSVSGWKPTSEEVGLDLSEHGERAYS
jgi:Amt family ammonium transporter